jgi:hypothetical protein
MRREGRIILYVVSLGVGMAFLDSNISAKGGLFIFATISSLYDVIHGWMTRQMDGWVT